MAAFRSAVAGARTRLTASAGLPPVLISDPAIVDHAVEPLDIPFEQSPFDVLFQAQHIREQLVEEQG